MKTETIVLKNTLSGIVSNIDSQLKWISSANDDLHTRPYFKGMYRALNSVKRDIDKILETL